ncbi:hypothetical protein PV939_11600, partial [Ligilactobacillus salivarius]|nr:hypothetical protein [Ligilactobacillus salivarius]
LFLFFATPPTPQTLPPSPLTPFAPFVGPYHPTSLSVVKHGYFINVIHPICKKINPDFFFTPR